MSKSISDRENSLRRSYEAKADELGICTGRSPCPNERHRWYVWQSNGNQIPNVKGRWFYTRWAAIQAAVDALA
jgi:hypothetical protein